MTRIALIAVVAKNGIIGREGDMPWYLPSDLKRFKAVTMGKPVIMGRKTLQSIGKPLPGRDNIIVTRQPDFKHDGVDACGSLEDAIALAEKIVEKSGAEEIMVAGGGEIYRQAMGHADKLIVTEVELEPEGDTRFPEIDPSVWREAARTRLETGPRDSAPVTEVIYERR